MLECVAKVCLQRLSIIWSSPLSDYNRVLASNRLAMPEFSYLMWTQHWPLTELRQVDRDARKIIVGIVGNISWDQRPLSISQEKKEDVVFDQWRTSII